MDIELGSEVEICCFNGSIRLASRKSNNYVIMTSQILNLDIVSPFKRLEDFISKQEFTMTKEQALVEYIDFMRFRSTLPQTTRDKYVKDARTKLNNLRENKLSDPDRYNLLVSEHQDIRNSLANNKPADVKDFNEVYGRFSDIGIELTSLWEEIEDIFA